MYTKILFINQNTENYVLKFNIFLTLKSKILRVSPNTVFENIICKNVYFEFILILDK